MIGTDAEFSPKERVKNGTKNPIAFYYTASFNILKQLNFINVYMCLNDKFSGRILQQNFFAVAEASDKIFEVNRILINEALRLCSIYPEHKFSATVSARYLENDKSMNKLIKLLGDLPENFVFTFSAYSLAIAGGQAIANYELLRRMFKNQVVIEYPESEAISILAGFPCNFIKLDGRYYEGKTKTVLSYLRLLVEFTRTSNTKLIMGYVNDDETLEFFRGNGISIYEGDAVMKAKVKPEAIIAIANINNNIDK